MVGPFGTGGAVPGISINHVSLSVVDMEESLRFYTEFLGMERIPGPQFGFRVEWLRVGDLPRLSVASGSVQPRVEGAGAGRVAPPVRDDQRSVHARAGACVGSTRRGPAL